MKAWIPDEEGEEVRRARRGLVILIRREGIRYRVTDNRSGVEAFASTELEALLEYYTLAIQAGVLDPNDRGDEQMGKQAGRHG